jgi:hypothetical protein
MNETEKYATTSTKFGKIFVSGELQKSAAHVLQ